MTEIGTERIVYENQNRIEMKLKKEMENSLKTFPGANRQVLQFIIDLATCAVSTEPEYEAIRCTFRAGYCWHFATLLKATFKRGTVCWAAPFGHFVWLDDNGVVYDVEGVYCGEYVYFIPESYLGDMLNDFLHIPYVSYNAMEDEIMDIIHKYEKDQGIPSQDDYIKHFLKP